MKYDLKVAEALEGVNDALIEIKKAFKKEPPGPYVPTGFPCYSEIKVSKYDSEAGTIVTKTAIYRINDDGNGFSLDLVSGDSLDDSIGIAFDWSQQLVVNSALYGDIFSFNPTTFKISNVSEDCEVSWVDPSAL